jgi:ketosteroid isomerase-like protein
MQYSTELQELYVQICEAQTKGDYSFFERRFSKEDGVLAIGTDPAEWWAGYDTIARVFRAQLEEAGGFQILADTPLAYSDGSIGWVAGRPIVKLPDGREMPIRLTAVLRKEQDDWKIVQWHTSTGIANEDLIGETLTTE